MSAGEREGGMTYYHWCAVPVREGSILEPGNWGRIVSTYDPNEADNRFRLVREAAYEFGRQALTPDAPSRLHCIFSCPTLDEAKDFHRERWGGRRGLELLYEVEPIDSGCPVHVTSWTRYDLLSEPDLQSLQSSIRSYWLDEPNTQREVLLGGPVRILRSIAFS